MKIKTTRNQLFNLLNVFKELKDKEGTKFAYAILKNKKKIINEIKTFNIDNQVKPIKEYNEFQKERIALCNIHCAKLDNKPVIKDNNFVGLEGNKVFDKGIEELKKNYKPTLDNYQKQVNEYNKKLTEEIDFGIHQIDKKDLPTNITPKQLESILLLVKE